jgi:uncharacterized paraquat-inducible protein A
MRKRVIVAIIVLAICLIIVLIGAPFFSYLVNMLLGGNLKFQLDSNGILYMYSDTGNANGPLWAFILLLLIPIGFIIGIVVLLLEVRYRSKKKKQTVQSYTV